MLAAGVAALIVVVVFAFGGRVENLFHNTCDKVASNTNQASCS